MASSRSRDSRHPVPASAGADPADSVRRRTVTALRRTREAIEVLDDELGDILVELRENHRVSPTAPDRLRTAAAHAQVAMAAMAQSTTGYGADLF